MQPLSNFPKGQKVLLRCDLNLPRNEYGIIVDDTRLRAILPTIKSLLSCCAKIVLVSHSGRPEPGVVEKSDSLYGLADYMSQLLGEPIGWLPYWPYQVWQETNKRVYLAENTRFLRGEASCDSKLVESMLDGVDSVVFDAFSVSHRDHASTTGILHAAQNVYLGLCCEQELQIAQSAISFKGGGLILGGGKSETKISVLQVGIERFSWCMIGGRMIAHFERARRQQVSDENDQLAASVWSHTDKINLPEDVCLVDGQVQSLAEVDDLDKIIDIGPVTIKKWQKIIKQTPHVVWNGPMGYYEREEGKRGSVSIAKAMSVSKAHTIIGGGDTISVCQQAGVLQKINQVSLAGGAFLYYMSGKKNGALGMMYEYIN